MNPNYREAIRNMPVHDFLARHASLMRSGHGHHGKGHFRGSTQHTSGPIQESRIPAGRIETPSGIQGWPAAASTGKAVPELHRPGRGRSQARPSFGTSSHVRGFPLFIRARPRRLPFPMEQGTHHQRLMNSGQPLHAHAMSHVAHSIPMNEFIHPGRPVRVDGPLIHPLMEPPVSIQETVFWDSQSWDTLCPKSRCGLETPAVYWKGWFGGLVKIFTPLRGIRP